MKIDRLKNSVLSLAAKPEIQVCLYPNGTCKGDELVLGFDDAYRTIEKQELSQAEVEALESLSQLLSSFSGKQFEDMYLEDEALFADHRWEEIRSKAKEVITAFYWTLDTPRKNGSTYVLSNETIENE